MVMYSIGIYSYIIPSIHSFSKVLFFTFFDNLKSYIFIRLMMYFYTF